MHANPSLGNKSKAACYRAPVVTVSFLTENFGLFAYVTVNFSQELASCSEHPTAVAKILCRTDFTVLGGHFNVSSGIQGDISIVVSCL